MLMDTEKFYASQQIRADISFLKYQLDRNCKTTLIAGTGISKLIEDCENYLSDKSIYLDKERAVHILYTLVGSIKLLWFNDVDFCQQFNSLNSGDYEYGKISPDGERFYKDFEFEIFAAAMLASSGLKPILPDHTSGNDIFCNDIEIQCKHPSVFSQNNIDKYIQKFHSSLIANKSYGIFAVAVEDSFDFAKLQSATSATDFERFLEQKRKDGEEILKDIFEKSLVTKVRILGVFLFASYYKINFTSISDFRFVRDTNSIFCFRPDRKEIKDDIYKKAYKILCAFNPSPSMLTIEEGKLVSINNRPA
jgi:hypothetical protein